MDRNVSRFTDTRSATQAAKQLVRRVFRNYTGGLCVRFWDGEALVLGPVRPAAILNFRSPGAFRDLILKRDPLRLADAYFSGEVEVEGDLYALLSQNNHLQALSISVRERLFALVTALRIKGEESIRHGSAKSIRRSQTVRSYLSRGPSRVGNRDAIAFHYDVSNDFYRLWLDPEMVYSCAYFEDAGESLAQAQRNKLHHICRKLRLKPGERLLDIGCGWGALICWAAMHYGVIAHGITLSRQQYEFARHKIHTLGLDDRVTIEMRDYRDLPELPIYDKLASVGMFEHVGLRNLPLYFRAAHRVLKPGGLFLNHGITNDQEGWRRTVGTEFMRRYVFPDGELDTVSNIQRLMEQASFEILDVEGLRLHYALTLRHWVTRLDAQRQEARNHVPEPTYRTWRLYMAACALQFERGGIGLYQILVAKRHAGPIDIPFTRRDLYLPADR